MKILADKTLKAVQVVAQQFGVVVEHLLEVRHHPALVDAVTVETAGQLVVDAAPRHLIQSCREGLASRLVVALMATSNSKSRTDGCGNLGCEPNPPLWASNLPMTEPAILSTRASVSSTPRPEKFSLCSMAAITLCAVSSASSRRSRQTWARVNRTCPKPGRP